MYLDGRGLRHRDRRGELIMDSSYLLLLHAGDQAVRFLLPARPWAVRYHPIVDTNRPGGAPPRSRVISAGTALRIGPRSVLLLRSEQH